MLFISVGISGLLLGATESPSQLEMKFDRESRWVLGVMAGWDVARTDVGGGKQNATGGGYGISTFISHAPTTNFRLTESLCFRSYELKRRIDPGAVYSAPAPVSVNQSLRYIGLGVMGSYPLREASGTLLINPQIWLDFGLEYLIPLSARQEGDLGNHSFKPNGRPLFLVLGLSFGKILEDTPLSSLVLFQFYYHLTGRSDNRMMGLRMSIALAS